MLAIQDTFNCSHNLIPDSGELGLQIEKTELCRRLIAERGRAMGMK
jgi:hypothetical protein